MRRITSIIAATLVLSACGSEQSGEFTTEDGDTGEYTVDTQTGEATATIQTEDGTATFRSGADVPVKLPPGFTLYPGAEITSNSRFDQEGDNRVVLLSFESEDSPADITKHYRSEAEAAGYTIMIDATINGGTLLTGKSDKDKVFTLNTSVDEGTTSVQLTTGLGNLGG